MAGKNSNADKMAAANLKDHGAARSSMRCPCCHVVLSSRNRITPAENNPKGFSHFDFGGALHSHFASGCARA